MARSDFRFVHPMRVRWAETDMQGVVFNGNYMTYCDVGITEYLRVIHAGDVERLRHVFERMYVVKSTLEYHAPARFDEEIDVCVRTARLGGSSQRVLFEIHRGDHHLLSGESVYVYAHEGRSERIPEELRERIRGFETTRPEE